MNKSFFLVLALLALVSLTVSSPVLANNTPFDPLVAGPALAVTTTISPVADSYVNASSPSTNYGSATQVRVDGSPIVRSYLRFTVSGLTGTVSQATLRMYANSSLNSGITASRVADNSWGEGTINYGNAPAVGAAIGSSAAIPAATWLSINVTPYVTGNGTFSFALTSTNATALSLASREATNKPQLVVTTGTTAATATAVPPTATKAPPTATLAPATVTPSGTGGTLTVNPVADAHVNAAYPTVNYGTAGDLREDGSPVKRGYLRFNVAGLSGAVSKATLRLYANSSLSSGITVRQVADNTWGETTINYNNAPALGTAIATTGAVTQGTWISIDVTSYVTGNGIFSFALTNGNATALSLASREAANKPQLVITTGSGTVPTATKPAPTATSVGPTATRVPPTATQVPPTATRVPATSTPPSSGNDPVILATGDSRSGCNTGAKATAGVLSRYPSSTLVLFDGDATDTGSLSQFTDCFNATFGAYKSQFRPVPGNHEYGTSGASGYFTYFGTLAKPQGQSYYSFNVGTWHIVALNTEIDISSTSTQMTWLRNDLAANRTQCTLAYWHEPRWSSGNHGNNTFVSSLWQVLYDNNVDLIFNGHDHDYERFAPQNPAGAADNARGMRQFVIGTAGAPPYSFATIRANSEVRMYGQYGLVQFTLHPSSYDWKWVGGTGTFADSGSTACH